MTIKIKKRAALLIAGVLALAGLLLLVLNKLSSPAQAIAACAFSLIAAGCTFLYFRATGTEHYKLKLANLVISAASFVMALILAEILARVYLFRFASTEQFNQYASANQLRQRYGEDYIYSGGIAPHRYIGYIPAPNYQEGSNQHNSLGFRGDEIEQPKPDGIFRIVCLGGSTTYSAVDDYTKTYPSLLQDYLHQAGYTNIEVINAGMVGYTSWETLVNLEFRVLDLDPDLLIIYHAINDVYMRIVWPPDAYRGDNSGARTLRLQSVQMPPIWEYSTLFRMAAVAGGIVQPHSAVDWQFIDYPPTAYADLFLEQKTLGTYPSGVFDEVTAETMVEENPPVFFERNLMNIAAIANAHEIDVVLLTFAYGFANNPRVSSPEFQKGIAEGNEVVERVAVEAGVYLYDFANTMPPDRKYYASDGHHFTEEGNELRASLIGDYLIELGILPD